MAVVTAGAGFLLAVLWFDLMFDVQVLGHRGSVLPDEVLDSIAGYYRRVTETARPMTWLVAVAMAATLVAVVVQIGRGADPAWVGWASLALAGAPIALALGHTFPQAARLGGRSDPLEEQSRIARSICRDHLICVPSIAALIAVQLVG